MTDLTQGVIDCWRADYYLYKTPHELHAFWGYRAPSGAVLALKTACNEIESLRKLAVHRAKLMVDMAAECERLRADRDLEKKWRKDAEYDLEELIAAAVAADRERICLALPGGWSVDPQWVADMVRDGSRGVTT